MPTPSSQGKVRFGPFELEVSSGELHKHGKRIRIQRQPLKILAMLVESPGELITREQLRTRLWPDGLYLDFEHGLNRSVNKLRRALLDSADSPRYIETLPSRGYRFIAPVEVSGNGNGHPNQPSVRDVQILSPASEVASAGMSEFQPLEGAQPEGSLASLGKPSLRPAHRVRALRWLLLAAALLVGLAGLSAYVLGVRRSRPVLSNSDLVLISDSVNTTGDAVFDDTLKQALAVELTQSPYLNVMAEARISSTLELMMKPANAKLLPQLARDVCQRAGAKAYIVPSIANIGRQYLVTLDAVSCSSGDSLAKEQAAAASKEQVLRALDAAAARFRKRLGESLASVQTYDSPLEQATTPSLEALKSYSLGNRSRSDADAIPLFKRAVELDPHFALAYDGLGISYSNLNQPGLAAENVSKAYELRDHAGERERLRITTDYYQVVTGELEKANRAAQLWVQVYPRDHYPHDLLGVNFEFLGKYEEAVTETKEALRLNPDSSVLYSNLMENFAALGRLDLAKTTYQQAMDLGRDQIYLHADRYGIAFLEKDSAEMSRQVAWSEGKPGAEDWLLSHESDTNAFFGRLKAAREYSARAIQSATADEEKEAAALWRLNSALREAEVGNFARARKDSQVALGASSTRDVKILAALALARSGDNSRAEKLADDLAKEFPLNTVINAYWLPSIRAAVQLNRGGGLKALDTLRVASNYELGGPNPEIQAGRFLYPVYLRGQSYLALHDGASAAIEFQKMLDRPGIVQNCPLGALAHLGVARAYALSGDLSRARSKYRDFLALWKDGDPEIPLLRQAYSEYARLR